MRKIKEVVCLLSKFQGLLIKRMESDQNSLSHNSSLWASQTVFPRLVNTGGGDTCITPSLEVFKAGLDGVLIII